jgi:hypothetical protein
MATAHQLSLSEAVIHRRNSPVTAAFTELALAI